MSGFSGRFANIAQIGRSRPKGRGQMVRIALTTPLSVSAKLKVPTLDFAIFSASIRAEVAFEPVALSKLNVPAPFPESLRDLLLHIAV